MANPYIPFSLDLSYVGFEQIEEVRGAKDVWIILEGGNTILVTREQIKQIADWQKEREKKQWKTN